ncbi:hypothetical protein JRO89_XS10G0029100 [Xanthoceras sorbifolium]|uniref:Receptor-like serine/threonine-protein kinase n=1 Tax=Xanthoceras sorbifolium TaxID=99658 RepID=A0ABQ8HHD0_9ROSI|nr:hypothetical protein JRO89_XS10G0029100 [Xanthoceras sorbifolium]
MAFVPQFSLYFLILLLMPFFTFAQTPSNKTLGSSLTASNDNSGSSWVSPSGEFAFGFRQIGDQGFLLAIWFDKIPEKTIVWSANRNELVQRGSKSELTADGPLVLRDATGRQIWSVGPGDGVVYGAMLDTGNFVLAGSDSVNLWESFDMPTDTMLPTQTMSQGSRLVARFSDSNYSSGRFMFELQSDGNLLLYTTTYPKEDANAAYWSTQSSIPDGFQVIFNQSGYMYLIAKNGSILNPVFSNTASTQNFYQRAIVDSDGVFRHYIYPKSSNSSDGNWPMAWSTLSFIPSDICVRIAGDKGSGACGFNSYCSLVDDRKKCQCPPGYTFFDPEDVMKGCKQNFVPQSCDKTSEEMHLFEFRDMINTDWPNFHYESYKSVSEDWCRQVCLSDCFCSAAFFKNGECWKKQVPLGNGRNGPSVGGKALIKIRKDNSTGSAGSGSNKEQNSTLVTILSALLGSSIFVNILLLLGTFIFFYCWNRTKQGTVQPVTAMPSMNLQSFTYKELEHITEGFKEELGSGAFGTVYIGVLAFDNNEFVAIKRLDKATSDGEQEFRSEVNSIGRTNHKNLVRLLGFCNEGQNRLLVYEYMSNGSLANFLFGNSRPNWESRIQSAFGTARGLFYLHEECNNQIIHCDIKPQNILLDDCLTARISDFGLAKLLKADQTQTTTAIRGTKGYVAPEWFKNLPITVKVDVYSFGVLLLELVSCRKNFEANAKEEQMILSDYAYDCLRDGNLDLLVENDEEAMNDMKRVKKFVRIAIWCIQEDPSLRPTMKKVTQMMEGAVEVSAPPDPTSFISSIV